MATQNYKKIKLTYEKWIVLLKYLFLKIINDIHLILSCSSHFYYVYTNSDFDLVYFPMKSFTFGHVLRSREKYFE